MAGQKRTRGRTQKQRKAAAHTHQGHTFEPTAEELSANSARHLLSALMDSTSDLVTAVDANLRYIACNEASQKQYRELFGVELHPGASLVDLLAAFPEDQKKSLALFGRALRGETVVTTEEFGSLDKARRIYELRVTPIRDDHDTIIGAAQTARDFTERKRAEDALRQSDEQFRAMFSIASVGKAQADPATGRLLRVNEAFCRMTGYTEAELLARTIREITHPEDRDPNWTDFTRVASGQASGYEADKRYLRADGQVLWVHVSANLIRDSKGRPFRMTAVIQDVTQRKRAEDALRKREEEFRAVFESSSDCILVWDRHYNYLYANQAAIDHVGTTRDKVIGKNISDGLGHIPDFMRLWMQRIDRAFATGKPFRVEDAVVVGNRVVYSESQISPIRDAAGQVFAAGVVYRDVTERKRAEDALRESEARVKADIAALTRMHELSGRLLAAGGLQAILQDLMHAAVDIAGADKGTLQLLEDDSLRIVAHHGHQAPFLKFFAAAENRASVCGEATKSGQRVVVPDVETSDLFAGTPSLNVLREAGVRAVQSTPLMSRAGKLLGILTTQWTRPYEPNQHDLWRIDLLVRQAADLIEHARAEEELRETESRAKVAQAVHAERQRFYDLLNMLPTYVVLLSPDYHVPFANRIFEERFGKSNGRRCFEYLFNRTEPCENCETFTVFKTNAPHNWEWQGPDGRNYEIHDFPFTDADGTPMIMETGIDITARKKAEAATRAERQRFYDVLETLPAMICLLTPEHRVTFANRGFRDRFGEANGRYCYEYCHRHGRSGPCDFCESYTVLKTGKPHHWEITSPAGWVIAAHDYPFTDVDGSPMILEMDLDITEMRKAQGALKEANARLEERTAKLQELVGDLEHFSYTITHDMRAPLRAMMGFAEVLNELNADNPDPQQKEFLRRIAASARRMDLLITDALNYSRVVRQELPLDSVDLGALLRGMLDSYPELQPSRAQIRIDEPLPVVVGNEAGLTQCLSNLLGNAVKFVKPGQTPQIRVWAEQRDDWARICVEDNGIGVPSDMLPRIFDMFTRGSSKYEGTGIGLALVRKVVQRMGGKVGVESTVGQGSRFWLELRCAEVP